MASMILHWVCLVATDDGENKAFRNHVVSRSLKETHGLDAGTKFNNTNPKELTTQKNSNWMIELKQFAY